MGKSGPARHVALATALWGIVVAPAFAQSPVRVDRGLTEDLPYTAFYPSILRSVDDGNSETILTLRHPDAVIQCDVFAVQGAPDGWTAENALKNLDVPGIEATWAPDFPGFSVTAQSIARFASGPALLYEGASDNSPMGIPVIVVHAEAVDGGRTYAVECLSDRTLATEARPMIDFIVANFSTRSDGQCCIDPANAEHRAY